MSSFKEKFDKVGGKQLVKQYARAGVLPTAAVEILEMGTSQKALEILRLSVQYKTQKRLYKEFGHIMKEYVDDETIPKHQSNKVWVCWLQGMDNAPLLVQRCYHSLVKHLTDREIIVLTEENISKYIDIPLHIQELLASGKMTKTFFSDILRLEILIKYGGLWIDATVLCTSDNVPSYIYDSDLFLYQILKPGRDGHAVTISSWLISACTNNKVLVVARDMIYAYWEKYDYLMDYGLLHMFISMTLEYFQDEYKKIPKFCNSVPHILLLDAFEPFDEKRYDIIKSMTCFHKLSDKRPQELLTRKGTYYDMIVNEGIEE